VWTKYNEREVGENLARAAELDHSCFSGHVPVLSKGGQKGPDEREVGETLQRAAELDLKRFMSGRNLPFVSFQFITVCSFMLRV